MDTSYYRIYHSYYRAVFGVFFFIVFIAASCVPLWQGDDDSANTARNPYFAHPSTAGTLSERLSATLPGGTFIAQSKFYPGSTAKNYSAEQTAAQSEFSILANKIIQGLGLPQPVTGKDKVKSFNDPTMQPEIRELNLQANPRLRGGYGMKDNTHPGPGQDSSDMARQQAQNAGMSLINAMGEHVLSEYGQATFNFRVTGDGQIEGEGDILIPLYDGESTTVFTQIGGRSMEDDRWIANLGLGQRWFVGDSWTLGYNAFLDYDLTRDHTRASIGGEMWYDWLHLSGNYYLPLSSWKKSRDLEAHHERPAKGWDARVKGYVPWHRNLALTGSYTQWYGDNVGVFGSSKLESNPRVWSYGLEYTPIPLVSGFFDQRQSEGGRTDTEVGLRFTYHFSMPFEDQLKPGKVAEMRTQQASRHELVDRENKIILEYKEDKLKASLSGYNFKAHLGEVVGVSVLVQSAAAITSVVWEGSAMPYWMDGDHSRCRIKMPSTLEELDEDYDSYSISTAKTKSAKRTAAAPATLAKAAATPIETYKIRAVVRNAAGQTAQTEYAIIELMPDESLNPVDPGTSGYKLNLSANPSSLPGGDNSLLTATLTDNGAAVSGEQINWSVVSGPGSGTLSAANSNTSGNGQATVNLTGLTAGNITLRATLDSDNSVLAETTINITSDASLTPIYAITLSANPATIVNGTSSLLTATLTSVNSDISGHQINWSMVSPTTRSTPGDGSLSVTQSTTDNNGQTIATLNSIASGNVTMRATLDSDSTVYAEISVMITPGTSGYNLNLNANPATIASGDSTTLTANLTNNGTAVSAQQINWSVLSGPGAGTFSAANSNTDGGGNATVTLTGTTSGTVTLRATLNSNSSIFADVTVTVTPGTPGTPVYSLAAAASPNSIAVSADSVITATLTDNGTAVSGQQINWSVISGPGTGSLSVTDSNTDSSGHATVTLTGTASGSLTLRATLASDNSVHADVTVTITSTPIPPVYNLTLNASPGSFNVGNTSTLTATLTDNGSPVSGQQINWSVVSGTGSVSFNVTNSNTDSSGHATVTLTGTASGSLTLKATLNSDSNIFEYTTVTINPAVPVYNLTASAAPSTITNGGTSTITAILTDNGSPVSSRQINWSVVSGTGSGTLSVNNSNTNGSGQATVTLTGTGSGSVTLRAALASDSTVYTDVTITITPTALAYNLSASANPSTIINGNTSLVTATLTNSGSPVSGQQINWSVISGPGTGTLSATNSNTNTSGQATVTLAGTGSGTLTLRGTLASDNTVYTDVAITINPAPHAYNLNITANPASPTSGGSSLITATLTDSGSPVSGQQINWTVVSGSGGSLSAANSSTDSNGQATVTLNTTASGTITLRGTLASDSSVYTEITVTINPATPVYSLTAAANPSTITNGGTSLVTATLTDSGTPVSSQQINWSVVSGPGTGTLSASNSNTDGSGQATVTLTGTGNGTLTLRATLASDSTVYSDVTITINPVAPVYNLNITANPASPTSGGSSLITATLTDSGSPVSGQQINWTVVSGSGGSLSAANSSTDSSGQATVTLNTAASGTITLRGTLASDSSVYTEITVTINPATPVYSLTAAANPSTITNGGTSLVTATLTDSGTPVSSQQINWSVVSGPGTGTLSASNSNTDGSGQTTVTLTGTGNGTLTLRATLASDSTVYADTTITVNAATPIYNLNITANPASPTSGGSSLITATLTDSGSPVSGQQINWTVVSGSGGSLSTANSSTDGNGQATVTLNTTASGTITLRGTLASDSSVYTEITVTINPATPVYSLTASANPSIIGNGGTSNITATLTDNGTAVSSQQINWSVVSGPGTGTLSASNSNTDGSGQATVPLTGTGNGTLTLRATLASDSTVYSDVTITINPVAPAYNLNITANPVSPTSGGSSLITATLTDSGSPVSGQQINWTVVSGSGGSLSAASSSTDGSGQATVTLNTTASGTITLRGTLDSDSSVYTEITITINPATPVYSLSLSANPGSIANGGSSIVTATLTDSGTPTSGQQIDWSVVSGTGSGNLSVTSSNTDGSGQATVTLTGTGNGTVTLKATLTSDNNIFEYTTVTVTPSAPVYNLTLNANPTSITNGDTSSLTATLTDGGSPVSGQQINWNITSGPGGGSLSAPNSGTNAGGQATVDLTGTTSGSLTVRGTLAGDSSVYAEATITINPAPPVYSLTLNASPTSIANGDTSSLSAILTDNGSPVLGQQINWTVVSGTGSGTLSSTSSGTNGSGQAGATLTATGSGSLTLRATLDSDGSVYAETTITIAPAYSLTMSANPASIVNGGISNLSAILTDNGSGVSGRQINWSIVGGPGSGTLSVSSSGTDGSGQANVNLTATGSGSLTLRATLDSDNSVYTEATITVTPTYNVSLSASPTSLNNGDISNLTATLTDNGSAVTGQRINWSVVGGTGSGTLNTTNSNTDGAGQATAILTATTGGTLTLRATLAANSSVYTETTITIVPVYNLTLNANPASITNGGSSSLTAMLTDSGSAVSGQQVNWSVVGGTGSGTLSTTNSNTNSSGQASVNLTATASGTLTLRATLNADSSVFVDTTITVTPIFNLSLSANQTSITDSTLTAVLTDNGSAVLGQQINWSIISDTSGTASLSVPNSNTNAGGQASTNLTVSGSGVLTLRATLAGDNSVYTEITVTITPSYNLSLSANPVSLTNGGSSSLTAILTNNGSVVAGDQINWSITGGTGSGTLSVSNSNTNGSGQATVDLTATGSGTLTLRATLASDGSVYAETTIIITPAYSLNLSAGVTSLINGDVSLLTASLTDNGNVVTGQQINWSVVGGTARGNLSLNSSNTDSGGQATVNLTATASGTLTLRATLAANSSVHSETTVTITPAYHLNISAGLNTITNGGSSSLTALLTDNGNVVAGQQINWSVAGDGLSGGSLSVASSNTNSSGQATVNLTGTASGILTLRATLASDSSVYAETILSVIPVYNLALSAGQSIITNGSSSNITALLTDSGSLVAGQQINWSIVGGTGGGTLSVTNSNTDGSGQTNVSLTATASGSVTIRGTLANNNSIHTEITVIITPAYSLSLSASLNSLINGHSSTLTAVLSDNGSVVSGQQINWSVVSGTGGGSLSVSSSTTDGSGHANVNLAAIASGTLTLRATLAANSSVYAETTLTITPAYNLTLSASLPAFINGGSNSLTAILTDNGNVMAGQQVNWSIVGNGGSGAAGSLNVTSSSTNGSGRANVNLTATASGTLTLRATLAGDNTVFAETTVIIIPSYSLTLSASQSSIINGGSNSLTATLTDNGSVVSGQQVNWSVVSGTGVGSLSVASSNTNGSGQAGVNLTAIASGTLTLRATLAGDGTVFAQTTISILPLYNLNLSASLSIINNGGSSTLTALLTDNGNLLSGQQVNWSIISGSGTLSVNNSNTNSSGQASVNFTATASGSVTLRATLAANSNIHADTTITVIPVYNLTLSSSATGGTSSALTATLTDNGNVVAGQLISWSVISGNGSLSANSSSTGTGGQANVNLTANASGSLTIRATLVGNPGVYAETTITITPSYSLSLNANPVSLSNGGSSLLNAVLLDNGNVVVGQQINWSITGGTGSGTLGATSSNTNISGLASVSLTGTASGTLTLRATMAGNAGVYAETTVTIMPAYAVSISASPTTIANGGSIGLTATLTDNGSVVSGRQINWSIVGGLGGGTLSAASSTTNVNGQATSNLTATASGTLTLRAALAGNSSIFAETTIIITPTYSLTLGAGLSIINNGSSTSLNAVLLDNGNQVSGQQVNWSITSGSGSLSVTNSNTNSIGQATANITATASGTMVLRATLAGNASIYAETTIVVLPVYNLSLSASLSTIPNGGSSILTAVLNDSGSPLSGQQINWSITGGTGSGTLNVTNSNTSVLGQAVATVTGTVSGTLTLRATLAGNTSIYAETTITVTPVYNLTLAASPTTIVNGGVSGLTATLTDHGNIVTGQQINWSVVSGTGGGTLSTASSNTNVSGQAAANLTATASGTLTLRATLAANSSVSAQTTITITPVYSLTIAASPASIGNGSSSILTATLKDNGNIAVGQRINWSVVSGTGSGNLSTTNSNTNGSGQATATLASTVSGALTLRATLAGNTSIYAETTITITPVYILTLTPPAIVNLRIGDPITLVATLTDNGNPVSGQQLNWAISGLGVAIFTGNSQSTTTSTTGANGQTSVTLRGITVGLISVKAALSANTAINDSVGLVLVSIL